MRMSCKDLLEKLCGCVKVFAVVVKECEFGLEKCTRRKDLQERLQAGIGDV